MSNSFGLAVHSTTEVLELAIALLPESSCLKSLSAESLVEPIPKSFKLLSLNSPYWYGHRSQLLGRELSSEMHNCLASFLAEVPGFEWQRLKWLAVATGIGSFTSTRVGLVLVRTLAEQLDLPLYGVTCEAIASHSTELDLPLGLALLDLAYEVWQQGNPDQHHWSLALPLYGGEFGAGATKAQG
ncbi:MAG: hypothetical protein SFT94_08055 [Pseudanabaenaceae cyanobacterium bins.68]|nr:hypothetical protein [Pseudanabaenaceae cyanobacterium bins.68]